MDGIASRGQLRMSFVRWAVVCVPLIVLFGFAAGMSVPVGADNGWYAGLAKPASTPPDWVFPIAWTIIYILLGLALANILNARGARGRGFALGLFVGGFVLSLIWTPLFFGAHQIGAATLVIAAMVAIGIATAVAFRRIRPIAAWLLLPYLAWISFATVLTWRLGQLNPDAQRVVPAAHATQIL